MAVAVGGGRGRAERDVLRASVALAAAVLLLSLGVAAVPEEHRSVQEQPQQEKAPSPHPVGPVVSQDEPSGGNMGFIHAFAASISVIIVSELGDKTFFIAAIMAMRYNRLTVLAGAMLALGLMTCLSVLFGYATTIIPRIYTYYVSTALFAIFGVRMLREGLRMSPDEGQEELEEVQAEIKKKDEEVQSQRRRHFKSIVALGHAAGGQSVTSRQVFTITCSDVTDQDGHTALEDLLWINPSVNVRSVFKFNLYPGLLHHLFDTAVCALFPRSVVVTVHFSGSGFRNRAAEIFHKHNASFVFVHFLQPLVPLPERDFSDVLLHEHFQFKRVRVEKFREKGCPI
ncbi:hypothetical protein F2P81_005943 [Scophthalmus maximus]|uniref:GDT1 family protein n=1 Tax=Scophthalmus maximus TaxID=52904 RepID=A0A6A4THU4_SCOMX|nr:hypothetical protein F2P81_005943 [Scophthalmus maximus]